MHNKHIVLAPIRCYALALAQGAYFLPLESGTEYVYPLRMVSGQIKGLMPTECHYHEYGIESEIGHKDINIKHLLESRSRVLNIRKVQPTRLQYD